ncbi:MAG: hypothetical protein JWP63_2065, partial [Candidatus Solibacter sp.]|nr:hypothetical protein [Candidatus Solibacter sp.]
MPAGLISISLRPQSAIITDGKRWDPLWFALHEVLAFACWFLLGRWADVGRPRLGKALAGYLAVRLLC